MSNLLPSLSRWRGPISSSDFNDRVKSTYEDLVRLMGTATVLSVAQEKAFRQLATEIIGISDKVSDLQYRLRNIDAPGVRFISFFDAVDDSEIFNGSAFELPANSRLPLDSLHGLITLPKVDAISSSRLKVTMGDSAVPMPGLRTRVEPLSGSDTLANVIVNGTPEDAFLGLPTSSYERLVGSTTQSPASFRSYVAIPPAGSGKTNNITLHVYPLHSADIMSLEFTTSPDPLLQDTDGWEVFTNYHAGQPRAIGWTSPQSGYEILKAGPRSFYFSPREITAIRVTLRQRRFYQEASKFYYDYGIKFLDARYVKFLSTGKAIIRVDAPPNEVITQVTNVVPKAYNIDPDLLNNSVTWRAIYETASGSGIFTTTPTPGSKVWIELTLNAVSDGYTPSVSSLEVKYQ